MFVINLTYQADLSVVNQHLNAHRAFLEEHYNAGRFIASGRKNPRTGGIILANAGSLQEVERILQDDPFSRHGLARYEITEFIPQKYAPAFEPFVKEQ